MMNLRQGQVIPERQVPREKEKRKSKQIEVEEEEGPSDKPKQRPTITLWHIYETALLSFFDALMMPQEWRDVWINAFQNP